MALSLDAAVDFVREAATSATPAEWLWQLAAIGMALILGFFTSRAVCHRIRVSPRWKFGKGDFERVALPLFTLAFVALAEIILGRFQTVVLVNIVKSLLMALAIIRAAVFILGHIIPEGAFLRIVVRAIAWVAWIAVVLHVTGLLPDVVAALNDVGFTIGKSKQHVTLWLFLQGLTALGVTLAITMWLGRITETRVLAAETLQMSTRIVIAKVVRAVAVLLAILVALPMVGIDITALSIFSGAVGVGLGFGLQKIASNYVSGFIVLLDRSLRIGDVITVDGRRGEVKAIASRYTVIRGGDGVESIIPNETLITQSVNHHTYTDPKVSMVVGVSVSYESDVEKACAILLEAAKRQSRVIAQPPSAARIKSLADSGIELELTVWIQDPHLGEAELKSLLLLDVLKSFKAAGIEIPYPRRDVRMIATPETPETP
ncbi:MAG TPA: mechanosensitive ion channel domain-containing protein, partial [Usitatibacter sp.]|nr:mechanosensitive ion channel domain-containing protein [Usitatibacter sp.]